MPPTHKLSRAPHRIRIIGGQWKRTPIAVLDAPGLRPTPDRVRETVFNWIAHLRPDLSNVRGLDLFAGTGALGFELASRGAARVVLVERAPALLAQLRVLREKLQAHQVKIVAGDALTVAASFPAASFDLVFVDPPYGSGMLDPALAAARRLLAPGRLIYAEDDAPLDPARASAAGLTVVRASRAGAVCFHLLRAD
jgi:16S rRNA (guanine(966)-N(2))-methyltransferase RsmD